MTDKKNFFVIDTDCGVDDAEALILALSGQFQDSSEIVGITCVAGNATIDKVTTNVLRVLKVADSESIPVYRGAARPLIEPSWRSTEFHGEDGFAGLASSIEVDESRIKSESAITALIRLSKEFAGQLTLVTLGPLTNIGLAVCIDPEFLSRFKEIIVMGGNTKGEGNRRDVMTSEFNFGQDPESAKIVIEAENCLVTVVPWETCVDHAIKCDWFQKVFHKQSPKAQLYRQFVEQRLGYFKVSYQSAYGSCDLYAMAVALDQSVASATMKKYCSVELNGSHTRGQLTMDWNNMLNKTPNLTIVTQLDLDKIKLMICNMLD